MVLEIKENDFDEAIKEGKVLVDCYAPWCGPCNMLSPIIEDLANETESIKFYKLDVDEAEEITQKYGIMSIPTILIFDNGELSLKLVGFKSKEELEKVLKDL